MTTSTDSSLACRPRFGTPRTRRPTLGPRAAEVGAALLGGTPMMPWQRHVLDVALELDADGHPAYRKVVLTVPRQSGKTTLQLALFVHRALGWGGPQVMAYAAQTGVDARKKLIDDQIPILKRSPFKGLMRPRLASGHEAILWRNGSRHMLAANTEKSGHGGTLDLGLIDEAFSQVDARTEQAFSPAMSTRRDAQLWVVSTAGTPASLYLRGKVDAGRSSCHDTDSGSAYFEWSADDAEDPDDPRTWWGCMPALGFTVAVETIAAERASMVREGNDDEFRRAYLNQWRDRGSGSVIDLGRWAGLVDEDSQAEGSIALGVDVTPDRGWSSLAAAGTRPDGRWHVEVVDHRPGTDWLVARTAEVAGRWGASCVVLDPASAAGSLLGDFARAGVQPTLSAPRDMAAACGRLFDAVASDRVRHLGQQDVTAALTGAHKRSLADAWAWDRKSAAVDISPLVAITLALWAHAEHGMYDPLANFMPNVEEVA